MFKRIKIFVLLIKYNPSMTPSIRPSVSPTMSPSMSTRMSINVIIVIKVFRCKNTFLNFPLLCPYLVYANNEERIKGGGCLELRKYVEIELGLDPDSITGD